MFKNKLFPVTHVLNTNIGTHAVRDFCCFFVCCCQVDLHFRTLDFGQVTVGSSNVRNLAVTNNLPQAVLAELVGLEGQSELAGTGLPAQVVPAGATAGFDVHFKCHTEQVTLETRMGTADARIKLMNIARQ